MPTREELTQLQSLPLEVKIKKTEQRIKEWVDHWGEDGVYISFSGGKDSTVLLDIARRLYPNLKAVFVDTGLEFPEIRNFVKTYNNVDWLKPKKNFRQVILEDGYPFISKEVSECVYGARRFLKYVLKELTTTAAKQATCLERADNLASQLMTAGGQITSITNSEEVVNILNQNKGHGSTMRFAILMGMLDKENQYKTKESIPSNDRTAYSQECYQFFLDAPFEISSKCCNIMKKTPVHKYSKETGRKGITAQMASESRLRTQKWLNNGCNGFDLKNPISNPMGFWVEQDVLLYIRLYGDEMVEHRIEEIESKYGCPLEEIIDQKTGEQMFKREEMKPICSVYGDIVTDDEESGQMNMAEVLGCGVFDLGRPLLHTTGANRTGCMFCGYGCHLEKGEGRFERLKRTYPKQYEFIMKPVENGGLGYKEVIDWINEHGKLHIKY